MPIDLQAAEQFIFANARLLERHRLAALLHGVSAAPVLDALRAYRNPDGGFGHALEPDARAPGSEPVATHRALEVLLAHDLTEDPMIAVAAAWVASIAEPDGGIPFVLATAEGYPRAPWMVPSPGGSHLTFAFAGAFLQAGINAGPWLERATEWCWAKLDDSEALTGYWVKFGLSFIDSVPDESRAERCLESLRPRLSPDGSLPVPGGTGEERLMPLALSPHPSRRSRTLFSAEQIEADLDRLAGGQDEDGGWTFDWLAWSPGQAVEWRGIVTLDSLETLAAHGRIKSASET